MALSEISSVKFSIVVTGSYGRREATSGSDLDFFLLFRDDVDNFTKADLHKQCRLVLAEKGFKDPAADGAFNSAIHLSDIITQIGGDSDRNKNITRRILFLTESIPLSNRELYDECAERLLARYIGETISEHQLALFLLNYLIRYYRTVCVDFENKTVENNKDWGIRNIKLVFSRKLLYFGGILMVAETAQHTWRRKREVVKALMDLSPIERIRSLYGNEANEAIAFYDRFLGYLNNPEIREVFAKTTIDRASHTELFRTAKNEGQHFSFALLNLLRRRYPDAHPIHKSLVL